MQPRAYAVSSSLSQASSAPLSQAAKESIGHNADEAALRALLEDGTASVEQVEEAVRRLASQDLERTLELLHSSRFTDHTDLIRSAIHTAAEADTANTLKIVLAHPEWQSKEALHCWQVLSVMVLRGDAELAGLAVLAPGTRWEKNGVRRFCEAWLKRDAAGALRFALAQSSGKMRDQMCQDMIHTWLALDFPTALTWLCRQPAEHLADTGFRWSQLTPASLTEADLMLGLLPATEDTDLMLWNMDGILPLLLAVPQTHAWLTTVTDPRQREVLALAFAARHAVERPDLAEAMHELITDEALQRDLSSLIASARALRGEFEDAMTHAANLSDPQARIAARKSAFHALLQRHPERAASWLEAADLPENEWLELSTRLGYKDPALLAKLAQNHPSPALRERWLGSSFGEWTRQDPKAASSWVATLPQGAERDKAIGVMIGFTAHNDPSNAVEWALTVSDATERSALVAHCLATLAKRSPSELDQWLTKNSTRLDPASLEAYENLRHQSSSGWMSHTENGLHWFHEL